MDNSNLWVALAPGLVILVVLLLVLAYFLIRDPDFDQAASRTRGSPLLPQFLIRYAYWGLDAFITPMGRMGIRPNHITSLSVVLSATAAGLIANGQLMSAAWVLFGAMACDLVDGLLARSLDMQTASGAFFDSFCDRISEGIVFVGLAYWGRDNLLFFASSWGLIASFSISYARGRGEGLGVDCNVGLMQRPERLLVTFFTLMGAPLVAAVAGGDATLQYFVVLGGVSFLALLSTLTAGQRALWIMRALATRDADPASTASHPIVEASS